MLPPQDIHKPQGATFVVAASDSLHKERADYVCDGTADDIEIQQAITALPGGGGKVVLLEGTFNIDNAISCDTNNMILQGVGVNTILKRTANVTGIDGTGDNVVIRDLTVDGDNIGAQDGIFPSTVSGWTIDNCVVKKSSDGISLQGADHSKIINCDVHDNVAFGIHIGGGSHDMLIDGNKIHNNSQDGFYYCFTVRRTILSNNHIYENTWNGIGGLGGGGGGDKYNLIEGNVITNNNQHGIRVVSGGDNSIIGNIIGDNSQEAAGTYSGIEVIAAYDMLIANNWIYDSQAIKTQRTGICMETSKRINIQNNHIEGHQESTYWSGGIFVYSIGLYSISIKGNTLTDNIFGIRVHGTSKNVSIEGNLIDSNLRHGIYCDTNLQNLVISSNYVRNNGIETAGAYDGIYIGNNVINSIITNNRCFDDQAIKTQNYGIEEMGTSNYNIIANNHVKGNIQTKGLVTVGANNIVNGNIGYITKKSGSSTGTGAQQTIPHGLAKTPTKVILWNIEDGANPYQSAAADGTNIKITAVINQDWGWEAEVV